MSIIQEIQNKALTEGKLKAESVNSYKVISVRPNSQLSALIEVLAFLDDKSPSDFIYSNFGKALADFTLQSKAHIEPLKKAIKNSKTSKSMEFKTGCAIDRLLNDKVITLDKNETICKKENSRLLKDNFNQSVLDK